jgi:hypothetical protein
MGVRLPVNRRRHLGAHLKDRGCREKNTLND